MNKTLSITALVIAVSIAPAKAGEFNYDINVGYNGSRTDGVSTAIAGGMPVPSIGLSTFSIDDDSISLDGTWYFKGLNDSAGPRSRAVFLDRASGLNFGYTRGDESSNSQTSGQIFGDQVIRGSGTTDRFQLGLRYVGKQSGWYGLANASTAETRASIDVNGQPFNNTDKITDYSVGVGRYFGASTALDVSVGQTDFDGFDTANFRVSFTHLGQVGSTWQYATDLGLGITDQDGDEIDTTIGLSLFPNNDIEFGVEYVRGELNDNTDESFGGFASWYFRDNAGVSLFYRSQDPSDLPGTDIDINEFGLSLNLRF